MATAIKISDSMGTTEIEAENQSMITIMDSQSENEAPWSEVHHGEESLELVREVYRLASGGSASTRLLDNHSPILARFKSPMENTVLHLAAMHGNDAMVDRVATQYPDLQFSGNVNGDTPLHVAARAGHISTLRKLLDACAYSDVTRLSELVEMKNKQRNIVLHEAMMSGGSMASMIFHVLEAFQEWLSESCYELALNNVNNQGQSVLYLAVEAGLMEAVNRILDNCPGSAMPKGKSPLVAAIIKPEKGMVSIIIRKKQEWMHLGDKNGRLPLHLASSIGYYI